MRRLHKNLMGLTALGLAASAGAQTVTPVAPVDGNDELLGPNAFVVVDLATLDAGEPVTLELRIVTVADDDTVTEQFLVSVPTAATDGNGDGTTGDDATTDGSGDAAGVGIDLSQISGLTTLLSTVEGLVSDGTAASAAVQVQAMTPSGASALSTIDTTSGIPNEAADEAYAIDTDPATVSSAFINSDGDELLVVFNRPLSLTMDGTGANAANQTQIADVDNADFEVDSASDFGGAAALLGATNAAFAGSNRTAIMFDLNTMTANVEVGDFIRTTGMDITDILGNQTSDDTDGVEVEQLATFQVASVEFRDTVDTNGANVGGALAVTFNLPVNSGQLGAASFYDIVIEGSSTLLSDASDLVLSNPTLDPDDDSGRTVLLDVDSNDDNLGVAADGLNLDDDDATDFNGDGNNDENELMLSLNLEGDREMAANEPQSDFGGDYGDGDDDFDQEIAASDGIAPALAAGFGSPAFLDNDGDGTQDAVKLVFGETIDSASDDDGVTLRVNDTITVHPVDMIDTITGERTTAETDVDTAMDNDVIDVASTEVSSTDVDGDGSISSREMNNTLVFIYDPASFDWDGDGNMGGDDTDGEATGATDDSGLINLELTAEDSSVADANGTAIDSDITGNSTIDCANPILLAVNYFTGDNIDSGMQKISEQDGNVGDDDDNNLGQFVFTEMVNAGAVVEGEFRFGTGPDDRFAPGDSDGTFGAENNILQLSDNTPNGFAPGDSVTVRSGNGLEDAANNEFLGTSMAFTAADRTGPFVPLQSDINGNAIDSAFLVDTDADGFAERLDIFFTIAIDAGSANQEDFDVQGVDNDDLTGFTIDGDKIEIGLPDDTVSISSTVTVTYNGSTADMPLSGNGNPIAAMDDTFTAQQVPTSDVAGEFTAVMDIDGTITLDGSNSVPVGTKIFAFIATPVAKAIAGRMNNTDFKVLSQSSLNAFTNRVLGLSEFVYLYDDQGNMFFDNSKTNNGQDALLGLTVNANNLANVSFTGRGTTTPGGGDSQPAVVQLQSGGVRMGWDVLRSNDGTAQSLFEDGFGDEPIASTAVITDDSGEYTLHMTAPISAFGTRGMLGSVDRPIIMVVELPTGERFAVSGLLNTVNNDGPLVFNPNNRRSGTVDPAADERVTFDINLANVGSECVWGGWNLLKFARTSGFATAANQLPQLPRGVEDDDVVSGVNLTNATTLSQFVYFIDDDEDGEWTSDDDDTSNTFDSIVIDANCIPHFAFTLTSRGVQTSSAFDGLFTDGIRALVGGYALGFFNGLDDGSPVKLGVFQFGEELGDGEIFDTAFPTSNVTLGWALVSNVPEYSTAADFFSANDDSDYLIIFNRTDHDEVAISSASPSGGDTDEVSCQALFVHYGN